jgi:hypothetical protein
VFRGNSVLIDFIGFSNALDPAAEMKLLAIMAIVQSLNLVVFVRFHSVAGLRILMLHQPLTVYKRSRKKPMFRNRDRLFWSSLSRVWNDQASELIHVKPETLIRWRERKFREFWQKKLQGKPGRPTIPLEHLHFIRRISADHPEYGEDRITLESIGAVCPSKEGQSPAFRGGRRDA